MAKKLNDLVGLVFGRLKVVSYFGLTEKNNRKCSAWKCLCECGKECVVLNTNLKRGSTRSCGCLRKEKATKDLIGKKFGYLLVINKIGFKAKNNNDREFIWECICKCGGIHLVRTSLLNNGHVCSCGCLKGKKIKDLTGVIFGQLAVLRFLERKNNRTFWLCKCNCGNIKPIDGHHLSAGVQKSCGCRMGGWKHGLSKNKKEYYKYLMANPIRKLRHKVSSQVRKSLFKRGLKKDGSIIGFLPYTIKELKTHLENLWEPWMSWKNYGGSASNTDKTWWIDHIIPQAKLPYDSLSDPNFIECWQLSNLRPLEKIANIKKGAKCS